MSNNETPKESSLMSIKFAQAKPPVMLIKPDKDWVFYGDKNDYPAYLIQLYQRSVMHSTIINGKVRLICGQGWSVDSKGMNALEKAKTQEWIKAPNGHQDLMELTRRVAFDLEMFDGFYLQKINTKGRERSMWEHIPFQNVRVSKDGKKYYYTSEWWKTSASGIKSPNPMPQDAKDFKTFTPYSEKNKDPNQILAYKCYSPDMKEYPLPSYLAGITAIEAEARIDNFWLNYIKRGFSASTMINFYNGIPSKEERRKLKEQILAELTGDDGDQLIVNFAVDKEHGSEIIDIGAADFDKKFTVLKESIHQSILTQHGITNPTLLGIKTPGQLGNANEMKESLQAYQNWYVTPRQQILEYVFNELITYEDERVKMKLVPLKPIRTEYSENFIKEVLPKELLQEMVAEQLGLDLSRYINKPQVTVTKSYREFEAEGENHTPKWAVEIFAKHGRDKKDFEVIESKDFEFESYEKLDEQENLFKQTFEKDEVETIGSPSIKLPTTTTPKVDTKVMYSYEGVQDDRNRPFCAEMLRLDRYYTKDDMKLINAEIASNEEYAAAFGDLDYNVWKHRGGWYRKPNTDVSVPRCRHYWRAHLTIVKK